MNYNHNTRKNKGSPKVQIEPEKKDILVPGFSYF